MSSPRRKKRRRPSPALITSLTVCALATAAGASLLAAATAQGVTPSSYEIHGFDTSNNNHGPSGRPIDFRQAAAAGQQFVFLKATEVGASLPRRPSRRTTGMQYTTGD